MNEPKNQPPRSLQRSVSPVIQSKARRRRTVQIADAPTTQAATITVSPAGRRRRAARKAGRRGVLIATPNAACTSVCPT